MKLIKITTDKIQIKSNDEEFKKIKINDLLKVHDNKVVLVAMVMQLQDLDVTGDYQEDDYIIPESVKTIDCSIIGSVKNGMYIKAIDEYPTTNVSAEIIKDKDFSNMLGRYEENGFKLGEYAAYDCEAFVDGNKFFQRHSCILGNTGSGKSETVAKMLEEVSKLRSANVVVFDIHGEYSQLSYARNIKIGKNFSFPIWLFGFNDMVTNILKIKEETSTTIMTALRKCYYSVSPKGAENKPIYFDYDALLLEMEDLNEEEISTGEYYKSGDKAGMPKTTKGDFNGKLTSAITLLKDKQIDKRYKFLFKEQQQSYLYRLMEEIMEADKPVKVIDLSDIPHDIAIAIIGVITKLIYNTQISKEVFTPITLICDEAHVYIPNNYQLSPSEWRMVETFENIAKEGRKFGITLLPATQRPSELNTTILAQCANFIVSKLNNENDKSIIKSMLPEGSDSIVDAVTMFNPGEVLVIGDAAPIPLKIKVDLAKERPNSRTIDFWNEWKNENNDNLQEAIESLIRES